MSRRTTSRSEPTSTSQGAAPIDTAAANEAAILAIFREMGAREIEGPLPPARVLERVEGRGVVVELAERLDGDGDGDEHGGRAA